MGIKTTIQWADATINFWRGCTRVSEGCKFCYMERDLMRYGLNPHEIVKISNKTITGNLKKIPAGSRIFVNSWSDFFHADVPVEWRDEAWKTIKANPQFTWLILTKRPELIELPEVLNNVWLGTTVESDKYLDRIDLLKKVPSKKFLSIEPILSDFSSINLEGIDWVIVGGESGNDTGNFRYRAARIEWIQHVVQICKDQKIPVFVKQLGTGLAKELGLKDRHGGDINEWTKEIRIREI